MIDTKELRRLAQAATPGPWFSDARGNIWRRPPSDLYENGGSVARDKQIAFVAVWWRGEGVTGYPFENNARLIAASNPATVIELLDRLEAAEKDSAHHKALAESALRVAKGWEDKCDELRAKIEAMERQDPVAWVRKLGLDLPSVGCVTDLKYRPSNIPESAYIPLYALPGAQQCKNCNGMGDRFDPSGEKIPCDLCESNLEEIRVLVAEAAHDIVSGSDFWLSTSLAAKKIYALPGAKGEEK